MLKYFLQKLFMTILVIIGAASCSFLLLHVIPGDTADAIAGPQATVEDVQAVREKLGLDRPLGEQYIHYMGNLVKGDLGYSYRYGQSVWGLIKETWPATMKLAVSSMIFALVIGLPTGIYAATHRGKLSDTIAMMLSFIGVSSPSFWLGLLLILLFSVKLGWLPFYGMSGLASFVLPSITLGVNTAANIARMTRTSMLEVLGQDYIRTGRGKGLPEQRVIYLHALRNAAIAIVTVIGLQFGILLGGQVVTETIFSWPGIGRLIVTALESRDYQLVQGGILILSVTFAVINLFTDLIYSLLDPRIRY